MSHKSAVEVTYHLDAASGLVVPPENETLLADARKRKKELDEKLDAAMVKVGIVPASLAGGSKDLTDTNI